MTDKLLSGGCACGQVRYTLLDTPLIVQACHCLDCQKQSGSAFVINIWIEAGKVRFSGEQPATVRLEGGSGKPHDVSFCPHCGTTLMSEYHAAPGKCYFVRAGTLDKPSAVKPDVHIHTRSKLPWLALDGSIPVFEAFYNVKSIWPESSYSRLRANMAEQTGARQ
ncbi:MAG: hypothetical protein RLZZ385_586 [Pseudomonadota bacterium]|jgi:hypothetical protein